MTDPCKHNKSHNCICKVGFMEDSGRFVLEVQVVCGDCGKPFQFLGLQPGMDFDGARVSLDGKEMIVGIAPEGVRPTPLAGMLRGFDISAGGGSNQ